MITQKQKDLLTRHGQAISELVATIDQSNAALCIEWWEVGKELSKASYHDGNRPGAISKETKLIICECLGLSTEELANGNIGGSTSVSRARKFFTEFPSEEERDRAIEEHKTWSSIFTNAVFGKPPLSSAGSGAIHRSQIKKGSRRKRKNGRLIPPHNARIIWDKAIQDFMASTGEDYAIAREILFKVLSELDYEQAMRQIWENLYRENVR